MLGGKWNHMMSVTPGWTATYQEAPPTVKIEVLGDADMQIFIPGQDCTYGTSGIKVLPCLNPYTKKDSFVELYNKGSKEFTWKAVTKSNWLRLSHTSGKTALQERILVSIDWTKVPMGNDIVGEIEISSGSRVEKVFVPVFNPSTPSVESLKGIYVEDNGCVSINAGKFHRKQENDDIKNPDGKRFGL